eukprot:COSAG02_NODE_1349_length_13132_cov_8.583289_4_plen_1753_part_00
MASRRRFRAGQSPTTAPEIGEITPHEESTSGEEDVFDDDHSWAAALNSDVEAELYHAVEALDVNSKRQLLRLLQNAEHEMEDHNGTTVGEFLEEVGADKNREFELFEKNLENLKSFDLLLFRGSDFVSDFIIKLTTKHRGVDFFSHVGICLTPPLLPRDGHYMKRGKFEAAAKVLPFVQLRLKLCDAQSGDPAMPHDLSITVLQCRGLPSRFDEGGLKEDPYVRVSLTPYDDIENRSSVTTTFFRTKTVWHGGHNPQFAAHHSNNGVLHLPAAPHPQPPQLRIQVWDEDRLSPDELVGLHNLDVDNRLLQQMASTTGTTRWLLLDVVDSVTDGSIYSKIQLPNYHRPEDVTHQEGIKRIATEDHEHDLTLGPERKPSSENYTSAAARRMANFLNDPAAAFVATQAAVANSAAGFHGPNASGARAASLVAGAECTPDSRKGGSVIRGNVLMAPMGLDYKALYVHEKQRSLPWQERCLAAMYTWKYYVFLVFLALLTVCTFEAKSMTLTAAVHKLLSDDMNRRIGLSGTLRPFGWEWLWQHPVWVEVADWSLLCFLVLECITRVLCLGIVAFSSSWNNVTDISFVAIDAVLSIFEYVIWAELGHRDYRNGGVVSITNEAGESHGMANTTRVWHVWDTSEEVVHTLENHERWMWWEQTPMKFMVVVIMRNLKLVRLLPRLLALRKKVRRQRKGSKWGLHEVIARRTNRGIEISWANVLYMQGQEEDQEISAYTRGPLLIGIDPSSPARPATVLDKFTHIDHLQSRSDYCFKVPAVSVPDDSEAPGAAAKGVCGCRISSKKSTSPMAGSRTNRFVGYLQFDAEKKDVRDAWIEALNAEFARFLEDQPSSVLAIEVRQEQAELRRLAMAAVTTVRLSLRLQMNRSGPQKGRNFSVFFEEFANTHGIKGASGRQHNLSGDLGRLADRATTAAANQELSSHQFSVLDRDTDGVDDPAVSPSRIRDLRTTSKVEKNEVKLKEHYSDGSPVHYVWEASASGSIAGTQVLAEESGSGHIGVQIRNLNGVLRDYDGEIAALRLVGGFDQGDGESEQSGEHVVAAALGQASGETTDEVRHLLTRMHEQFYLRKYEVNVFYQLSALYPSLQPLATLCDYLCCRGRKGSESLFCSQFNADIYQGMGLMSPEVDPSTVLPVDFLPSLALPGFPRFASEIIPLKVRKSKVKGQYLLAHEEESAAKERWKLSSASIGLATADRFGEQGGNHHMTKHIRVSQQTALRAQKDVADVLSRAEQAHAASAVKQRSSSHDIENSAAARGVGNSSHRSAVRRGAGLQQRAESPRSISKMGLAGSPRGTPTKISINAAVTKSKLFANVKAGNVSAVKKLLCSGALPNDSNDDGDPPVCWASLRGHEGVVVALLAAGAEVNAPDSCGSTGLIHAAKCGHASVCAVLLESNADVHLKDEHSQTALNYAKRFKKHDVERIIEAWIDAKFTVVSPESEAEAVGEAGSSSHSSATVGMLAAAAMVEKARLASLATTKRQGEMDSSINAMKTQHQSELEKLSEKISVVMLENARLASICGEEPVYNTPTSPVLPPSSTPPSATDVQVHEHLISGHDLEHGQELREKETVLPKEVEILLPRTESGVVGVDSGSESSAKSRLRARPRFPKLHMEDSPAYRPRRRETSYNQTDNQDIIPPSSNSAAPPQPVLEKAAEASQLVLNRPGRPDMSPASGVTREPDQVARARAQEVLQPGITGTGTERSPGSLRRAPYQSNVPRTQSAVAQRAMMLLDSDTEETSEEEH